MTASGLGLNKFRYSGLITAFKNREPVTEETTSKIIELVKLSKGWSSVEASSGNGDSGMIGVMEEELYNVPTFEIVQRNYFNRLLTVYHTALHDCADLGSKEAVDTISEMLKQDGYVPDLFCVTQVMRHYLRCRDIKGDKKILDDYISSRKPLAMEFYTTLVQGTMIKYTPDGMEKDIVTFSKVNAFQPHTVY
jgi:hypothetical protein